MDNWETKPTTKIFAKFNHFYNGPAAGGGSIRLGSDFNKFINFFDLNINELSLSTMDYDGEERKFILLKNDLDKYLAEVKYIFENPPKEYIYFTNNENADYETIKFKIKEDFEELKKQLRIITEPDFKFDMTCKKTSSEGIYLLHENSEVYYYKLLRNMSIHDYSYFKILKLKKNKKIIYYIKLYSKHNKMIPKRMKNRLNDFEIDPNSVKQFCAALNANQNIILTGVPGTGKTHLATIFAEEAMGEDGYILTTATSDWTTFDTIGGLMPKDNGLLEFREGKFLQAIKENKWLIIDEINRADIDKAFGQLFTVLSGQDVELPYYDEDGNPIRIVKNNNLNISQYSNGTYYIGKDWRIIATMNSYDKNSLFDLSYAFMRRFTIIEINVPNTCAFLEKFSKDTLIDGLYDNYKTKLRDLYSINSYDDTLSDINEKINRKIGPAIFLDILKYVNGRSKLEDTSKYDPDIFAESIISFMIPQFEGMGRRIENVKTFFEKEVFSDMEEENTLDLIKSKLDDIKHN